MNERIRELSKQAWSWAEKQDYTDPTQEFSDILEEKFAELIVKECSYLADQAHYKATGGKSAGGYIRQHFGIK